MDKNLPPKARGEGVHTRQEAGPPSKPKDGQEMRYNDSDHKETPGGQWGW